MPQPVMSPLFFWFIVTWLNLLVNFKQKWLTTYVTFHKESVRDSLSLYTHVMNIPYCMYVCCKISEKLYQYRIFCMKNYTFFYYMYQNFIIMQITFYQKTVSRLSVWCRTLDLFLSRIKKNLSPWDWNLIQLGNLYINLNQYIY